MVQRRSGHRRYEDDPKGHHSLSTVFLKSEEEKKVRYSVLVTFSDVRKSRCLCQVRPPCQPRAPVYFRYKVPLEFRYSYIMFVFYRGNDG